MTTYAQNVKNKHIWAMGAGPSGRQKREQERVTKLYDEIFKRLDINQSGRISSDELVHKFEKYPSTIASLGQK